MVLESWGWFYQKLITPLSWIHSSLHSKNKNSYRTRNQLADSETNILNGYNRRNHLDWTSVAESRKHQLKISSWSMTIPVHRRDLIATSLPLVKLTIKHSVYRFSTLCLYFKHSQSLSLSSISNFYVSESHGRFSWFISPLIYDSLRYA